MRALGLVVGLSVGVCGLHLVLSLYMADANVVATMLSAGGASPTALVVSVAFLLLRLAALVAVPMAVGAAIGEAVGRRLTTTGRGRPSEGGTGQ